MSCRNGSLQKWNEINDRLGPSLESETNAVHKKDNNEMIKCTFNVHIFCCFIEFKLRNW